MGMVIVGFIVFVIWCVGQHNDRPRYTVPAKTIEPVIIDPSILAKQYNRSLREKLEQVHEMEMRQKTQDSVKVNTDCPPPWFIGTWGINEPSHAEHLIITELNKYKIKWYREVSFSDLILPSGGYPRFDFYIPKYQVAIEYQGIGYHSSPDRVASDKLKARYCKKNNISLHIYEVQQYRTMEKTIADLMISLKITLK
jgi:hypothetical protein